MTFTNAIRVYQKTQDTVKKDLASETYAYFVPHGHRTVMTSNGDVKCEGPFWILWDSEGYPYPITPEEFEKIYTKKDTQ